MVAVTDSFSISKYEITYKQYIEFLNVSGVGQKAIGAESGHAWIELDDDGSALTFTNGRFEFSPCKYLASEDCPVVEVTWYGANAYADWIDCRLPTQAEWEYAAKGGANSSSASDFKYAGSDNIDSVAYYFMNSSIDQHQVGRKKPNALGLYDMSGNVWEWCSDDKSPERNQKDPKTVGEKAIRGGAWNSHPSECMISSRSSAEPGRGKAIIGFRVVKDN